MSHTPGPWQWYWRVGEDLRADCGVFFEKREGHAYSVCRAPQYQRQAQWEADARLIAAAPDLIACCRDTLVELTTGDELVGLVARLKEVIAKVDGTSAALDGPNSTKEK